MKKAFFALSLALFAGLGALTAGDATASKGPNCAKCCKDKDCRTCCGDHCADCKNCK
jgi:hypothetical protein